ncbi:hypothetical protein DUI87_21154 [Hirundo rustica rustica]|uniref:Uncharacterized protein n=1 Tax=Hirundo rustica rustica TaxID=333673 RepID=A0A3M0JLR8_HIRRU|nr:hypothetical protein DUI87_21154 [Hirundo rustica rustica]
MGEVCMKRNKKEKNDKKVKNRGKRTTEERKVQMTVEEKFKIQAFLKKGLMNDKDEQLPVDTENEVCSRAFQGKWSRLVSHGESLAAHTRRRWETAQEMSKELLQVEREEAGGCLGRVDRAAELCQLRSRLQQPPEKEPAQVLSWSHLRQHNAWADFQTGLQEPGELGSVHSYGASASPTSHCSHMEQLRKFGPWFFTEDEELKGSSNKVHGKSPAVLGGIGLDRRLCPVKVIKVIGCISSLGRRCKATEQLGDTGSDPRRVDSLSQLFST